MFSSQPGVKIAGVLAEFVKAYETVPIGKLKYIARVLCSGLPEGRKGDAVIIKLRDLLIKRIRCPFSMKKAPSNTGPRCRASSKQLRMIATPEPWSI